MANELEQRAIAHLKTFLTHLDPEDDEQAYNDIEDTISALQQAQQPGAQAVATVKSWVNGSHQRHYTLEWHRTVERGTQLYTAPPPLPEGVSEEDVEAAAAASGLPVRFPNDRKRVVDALESYRARFAAKGGV